MLGPDDRYDIAHFEFIMRSARAIVERRPELADHISVSLHCELADILNAYTTLVEREGKLTGLRAYSAARPPHSEGLAVWIASYLANETNCMNINLLHLSSRKAVDAAWTMQQVFPHIAFRREVTVGHLLLDTDCDMRRACQGQSADPPARGCRGAVAGGARPQDRLDRQRSRLLLGRAEMVEGRPGQYLARQVRLRRHRIPAVRRGERGQQARPVLQPHGRIAELESGAAIRPASTKATSLPVSMPTSCWSIRTKPLRCAPPSRSPSRVIRRSKARNSPAGSRARSCAARWSIMAATSSARRAAAICIGRANSELRLPQQRDAEATSGRAPNRSEINRSGRYAAIAAAAFCCLT